MEKMFPRQNGRIYMRNSKLTVEAIVSISEVYATKHNETISPQLHDNLPQDLIEYQVIAIMMTENNSDRRRINIISRHIL